MKPSGRAASGRNGCAGGRVSAVQAFAAGWVCAVILGCAAPPLHAQAPAGGNETNTGAGRRQAAQEENQPPAPVSEPAPVSHLFDDWGGARTRLHQRGVDFSFDYTTESVWNAVGGVRRGADYAHQIGLQADIDWEKLAGIAGLSTHTIIINRAGRNASTDYVGDSVIQAQEIYGAGFDQAVNLVWFYAEEKLLHDRKAPSSAPRPR
ncbi:MAG: carbohydrate porin [Pseudomonadota bacterium]|nr:carbohydrate porin [Pseudomonadota bacterium]